SMLIGKPSDIKPSEITPRDLYLDRRRFIAAAGALGLGAALPAGAATLTYAKSPLSTTGEALTPLKDVTTYNNYYEFGTDKADPAKHAGKL
ncbi:hypothetical protein ABTC43_19220, partial [Acinetobacter baumannii]